MASNELGGKGASLSSASIGGTLFVGLGSLGRNANVGGDRSAAHGSANGQAPLGGAQVSSNELLSMITKGGGAGRKDAAPPARDGRSARAAPAAPAPHLGEQARQLTHERAEGSIRKSVAASPDNMAMLGLAEIIRRAHVDRTSLALGVDSEDLINVSGLAAGAEQPGGLDGGAAKLLCRAISSPWAMVPSSGREQAEEGEGLSSLLHAQEDRVGGRLQGAADTLDAILPACYNVQAPPHAATRIGSFTEETLFYMFYGMPRDRMQEMAARELTLNRGWRFHVEQRLWLVPSSASALGAFCEGISALSMSPTEGATTTASTSSRKAAPHAATERAGGAASDVRASYVVFDATTWSKVRREMPVVEESQLEDRFSHTHPIVSSPPSAVASPRAAPGSAAQAAASHR